MSLSELVDAIEASAPHAGYLFESVVKKSSMMDAPKVWINGWLYLKGKTLEDTAADPASLWAKWRAELGQAEPRKAQLARLDAHKLENYDERPQRLKRGQRGLARSGAPADLATHEQATGPLGARYTPGETRSRLARRERA